jgi:hypothetical protein
MLSPFLRAFYYSYTGIAHLLAWCSMAIREAVAIPNKDESKHPVFSAVADHSAMAGTSFIVRTVF